MISIKSSEAVDDLAPIKDRITKKISNGAKYENVSLIRRDNYIIAILEHNPSVVDLLFLIVGYKDVAESNNVMLLYVNIEEEISALKKRYLNLVTNNIFINELKRS